MISNVLSLFDGISCARVALDRAGFSISNYYASEIDSYAIRASASNYPSIIQLGDVAKINANQFSNIDLLIGGSPCQDLTVVKQDRKGLRGSKSKLFWEYVRLLKEIKPKWFILENVASMSPVYRNIITDALGVNPIMIDAALVSAQKRRRLFWTNIPGVKQPNDKGFLVKDILEKNIDNKYLSKMDLGKRRQYDYTVHEPPFDQKAAPLRASDSKGTHNLVRVNSKKIRRISPVESERLQGLPDNYTVSLSNTQRYKCIGNAFNVDVISHILSYAK